MGAILAKFSQQKTTYQILEELEEDVKAAEALIISAEKERRSIFNFYLVSTGLLVLGCLVYYFYFLPPTWTERFLYSLPLFVASIVVICVGRLGSLAVQKQISYNVIRLTQLREDKKKIIEKVMNTETYKVAIGILNRFGDKNNGLKPQANTGAISFQTPVPNNRYITPHQRLNPSAQDRILPHTSVMSFKTPFSTNRCAAMHLPKYQTQVKTPFPMIDQNEKNFLDKLLDVLIGDDQASQNGMNGKECSPQNGMVSLENYSPGNYSTFCKPLNPAKKIRPKAPALTIENIGSNITSSGSTSSSEKDSGSETEDQSKGPAIVNLKILQQERKVSNRKRK